MDNPRERNKHIVNRDNKIKCLVCEEVEKLDKDGTNMAKTVKAINDFIDFHKTCAK